MDHDIAQKKKHRKSSSPPRSKQSKFFPTPFESKSCGVQRRHSEGVMAVASSSKPEDKENFYITVDDDDEVAKASEPDLDGSDVSLKVQYDYDADMDLHEDDFPDVVEQEDGYISPTPSCSKDLQDLSSPLRSGETPARSNQHQQIGDPTAVQSDEDFFGVEAISSPVSTMKQRTSAFVGRGFIQETPTKRNTSNDKDGGDGCISPIEAQYLVDQIPSPILYYGPDLRNALALSTDSATDLDYDEPVKTNRQELRRRKSCPESRYGSASPPSPSPDTSDSAIIRARRQNVKTVIDVDTSDYDLDEEEVEQARANASRTQMVMNGWRNRWALTSKKPVHVQPAEDKTKNTPGGVVPRNMLDQCTPGSRVANLKRSDTNITPQGRHALSSFSRYPRSAPSKMAATGGGSGIKPINTKGLGKARRSILFVNHATNSSAHGRDKRCVEPMMTDNVTGDSTKVNGVGMVSGQLDDIASRAHERLSMFR